MIEELWALGRGVVEKNKSSPGDVLIEWITSMNPFLPTEVGVLDANTMQIVTTWSPRTQNGANSGQYVLYMSGANSDPATYSPALKAGSEKSIKRGVSTLLAWTRWPQNYRNALVHLEANAATIAGAARNKGVKYLVVAFQGKTHAQDPYVKEYVKDAIRGDLAKSETEGTCMVCKRDGPVTGAALRLANLKFATPDKEVFMPLGPNKDKAYSAQFPLCEEDAMYVMIGAAFAASPVRGRLRERISHIRGSTYEYLVVPMPAHGMETDVTQLIEREGASKIAAMDSAEDIVEDFKRALNEAHVSEVDEEDIESIVMNILSPVISYVSVYFLEIGRATNVIGSARYVRPNSLAKLIDARSNAQKETYERFGEFVYAPVSWSKKNSIFYDFVALQIADDKTTDNEMKVILKTAVQQYIRCLNGDWKGAERWLKHVSTKNFAKLSLSGKKTIEYLHRSVIAVLTVMNMGGGVKMGVDDLLEVVKSNLDQYVAFLAGLLSAEAMYLQRMEKGVSLGEEPFRRVVGNAVMGDLEDFKRILILAVDKINQYGGSPQWALHGYAINVPELLSVKRKSKTEDIRYAFVLGLLVGETTRFTKNKEEGGEKNGKET